MNPLSFITKPLGAILNVIANFFTATIPKVGEMTFNTVNMANKAVDKAHRELLIEYATEIDALYKNSGLSEEQIAKIEAEAAEYKNHDWRSYND